MSPISGVVYKWNGAEEIIDMPLEEYEYLRDVPELLQYLEVINKIELIAEESDLRGGIGNKKIFKISGKADEREERVFDDFFMDTEIGHYTRKEIEEEHKPRAYDRLVEEMERHELKQEVIKHTLGAQACKMYLDPRQERALKYWKEQILEYDRSEVERNWFEIQTQPQKSKNEKGSMSHQRILHRYD